MTLLDKRIADETCAACGGGDVDEEAPLSIHEFRGMTGREVSICNGCGDSEQPTLTELWDAIDKARNLKVGKWVRK